MNKNIEVLQEVLDLLEEEKRKFYSLMNENDFRIEEINSYLKELSKNEQDDFKVFSPRSAENKHREQIEEDISEKKKYEEKNIEYRKKIEYLKLLISKVNIVVDNIHLEDEKAKEPTFQGEIIVEESCNNKDKTVEDNLTDSVDDKNIQSFVLEKNHIAHQILNCVSFITSDAERAKIELTAIARKMKE